jgi:hypothetical protein
VTAPGGEQMMLQMAYFDRGREPMVMDLGQVLDIEDVAGGKVCALAGHVEPRDYADTAALLEAYSPAQPMSLARQLDPGLTDRGFADAGQRLDRMPDEAFTAVGLSAHDVTRPRERFASWPRLAPHRHADPDAGQVGLPGPGLAAWDHERPDFDLEAGQCSAQASARRCCSSSASP